jgi:hypothetical protein
MNKGFRLLLLLAVLAAAGVLLIQQFQRLLHDRTILPPDDFVEYWAAGWLNAHGENPYDPDKLLPLEQGAGRDTDEAIMMWNPPWTLTVAMPFGLLESRAAQLLWVGLGMIFIVFGSDLLWRLYDGPTEQRWIAWLLAFTFLPTLFVLQSGQIGTWVLAGAVLFLFCQKRGWSMAAGASTVLLAIKPHLLYLFWIALIVWGIRRDRRLILAGLLAGIVATAIPLACNHQLLQQYWEAVTQRTPVQWRSPTLGTLIRDVAGESSFGLTFIPTLLGLGWLIWHTRRSAGHEWDWREQMPLLLLVSFVTASYGAWPFDLVILLPAVIQVAARLALVNQRSLTRWGIGCWLAINLPALAMNLLKVYSDKFIWMAPAMLLAYYILLTRSVRPALREGRSPT